MKNIIKTSILLLLVIASTSCEDFLEAPAKSSLDEQTIFSTPAFAEQALAGVIVSFGEQNSYRGRFIANYGVNTDVEMRSGIDETKYQTDGKASLCTYNTAPTNDQMDSENNAYAMFYQGIERANLAIRGLRNYADLSNPELRQILGEMLTLRAVVYNDLLRGWGNVPARFEPISTATINLPKSDRDVVLKQLLADLEEAANLVGWPNENSVTKSSERINKAFVKGLRARLALVAGGYSQHLNVNGNGESKLSLSADPDLAPEKMYNIAKKECLDVINSGRCRLMGFEECFRDFCKETYNAGGEVLWSIPFSELRGRVLFDLGVTHVNPDKYVLNHADGANDARGGSILCMPTLWFDYEKEDVRRAVTVAPFQWHDGKQTMADFTKDMGYRADYKVTACHQFLGKWRYEWLPQSRWRNEGVSDDGLNYMYMRYSDVLLMAAEAINELDGPGAAAEYFREVRARAYPNNPEKVGAYMAKITASKETFFKAIVEERGLEFAGEMLRKADLIRWNMLKDRMEDAYHKLIAFKNHEDFVCTFNGKTYPYSTLPFDANKNSGRGKYLLAYKTAEDNESIIIYGMDYGDAATPPDASYTVKEWNLIDKWIDNLDTKPLIYYRNPDKQPYWPIWQNFINKGEGVLNNDDYNMPE